MYKYIQKDEHLYTIYTYRCERVRFAQIYPVEMCHRQIRVRIIIHIDRYTWLNLTSRRVSGREREREEEEEETESIHPVSINTYTRQ